MIIDLLFVVMMVIAILKGWRRGLIIAIFSMIALVVGIAAALKLSTVVAGYLKDNTGIAAQWLPFVSFAVVFIVVVLLIRWGANLLEATLEIALLGWVNKLGGILLYMILYTLGLSVVLFYAQQLKLINDHTIAQSVAWPWIRPLAPKVIDGFGKLIPVFKDMFTELEDFFAQLAAKSGQ